MPVRGLALLRKFYTVLKRYSNYEMTTERWKYWYISQKDRTYLVHMPSQKKFDRVQKHIGEEGIDLGVDIEWVLSEAMNFERREAELSEEEKKDYEAALDSVRSVEVDFGGSEKNKFTTIPLGRIMFEDVQNNPQEESVLADLEPQERLGEEDDDVEYEDDASVEEEEDEDDYMAFMEGGEVVSRREAVRVGTRKSKREIEEKEEQIDFLRKKIREMEKRSARCSVEECDKMGDGMRCGGGHSFCVGHSEIFASNSETFSHSRACFHTECEDRLMLETMKNYVAGYRFERMKAEEQRGVGSYSDIQFDDKNDRVSIVVRELDCFVCFRVASSPVVVNCVTRKEVGGKCESVVCESCVENIKNSDLWRKKKECMTCKKHWDGSVSKNIFLSKLCEAVPIQRKG